MEISERIDNSHIPPHRLHEGERFHGFTVNRVRDSQENSGVLYEMTFDQTGTPLCWLDNGGKNKLFCASFRTPPTDDTGIFHILEHSVLCGSRNFPIKDPFNYMRNTSQQTYLNAQTAEDYTSFPVSSLNDRDFLNLTHVYLDAVFASLIPENPNILRQEGCRLEEEDGKLIRKGVVLGEMKGAYTGEGASSRRIMWRLLFPDTCYRFSSGGDPMHIPEVTQERFVETYRKYYHPSNACLWLSGDCPMEETFLLLEEYLSPFSRADEIPMERLQPVYPAKKARGKYEQSPEEKAEGKNVVHWYKLFPEEMTTDRECALLMMGNYLTGNSQSPLTKRLTDSGLCSEVTMGESSIGTQACLTMTLRDVPEERLDTAAEEAIKAAKEICSEGLDHEDMDGLLNLVEFDQIAPKDPTNHDKMESGISAMLWHRDPKTFIESLEGYKRLRQMLSTDEFEKLLMTCLTGDEGTLTLIMKPSQTLENEFRESEEENLRKIREGMTEEELQQLQRENEEFNLWQQTPDDPEIMEKMPKLTRDDICREPNKYTLIPVENEGARLFRCSSTALGITYVKMYFPVDDLSQEDCWLLNTLLQMTGSTLPTHHHTVPELRKMRLKCIGDCSAVFSAERRPDEPLDSCSTGIDVSFSCLDEKLPEAIALIHEMLTDTDFTLRDDILRFLKRQQTTQTLLLNYVPEMMAQLRCNAHFSLVSDISDTTSGIGAMQLMNRAIENFDEFFDRVQRMAADLTEKYLVTCSMTLCACTGSGEFDFSRVLELFPQGSPHGKKLPVRKQYPRNEALIIPSQANYVAACYHSDLMDSVKDSDTFGLCGTIVSGELFWQKIRLEGGAYGATFSSGSHCTQTMYSYRDPGISSTIATFRSAADFMEEYLNDGGDIDSYIIKYMAETAATPEDMFAGAVKRMRKGITEEMYREKHRKAVDLTREEMLTWIPGMRKMCEDFHVVAAGYREAIENCKDMNFTVIELQ